MWTRRVRLGKMAGGLMPEIPGSVRLAEDLIAALGEVGVTDIVYCPGSRDAPIAYALQDFNGNVHVRIDERVAAFTALGVSLAGGFGAVVTTSGSAPAHLYPAILEARHSGLPLVVVSADRPARLRGTGANQTTEQHGIFPLVKAGCDLSFPDQSAGARLRETLGEACSMPVGPVHVNLQFDVPLLPADTKPKRDNECRASASRSWWDAAADRSGNGALKPGLPTVVVAGDKAPDIAEAAAAAGVPIFAEPSSGLRNHPNAIAGYAELLDGGMLAESIAQVLVVGHPTLSRSVTRLLNGSARRIWVSDRYRPEADVILPAAPTVLPEQDAGWLAQWREADSEYPRATDSRQPYLRQLWNHHGVTGNPLVIGASLTIRGFDRLPVTADTVWALSNRGLAGIDGTISTASGVALASGRRTTVVLGDLTALHDSGALAIPVTETRPDLDIVIVDDAGGQIFRTLEYGRDRGTSTYDRFFETRVSVDFERLAAAFNVAYIAITNAEELRETLNNPVSGMRIIHIVIQETPSNNPD